MKPCNRIYCSKVYWRLNMFRAAHRSSSGAVNCICSLWFIYTCGDRPLSRRSGKIIDLSLLKAQHVSSGTPLIIRSCELYLQPLVYIHMWWPAVVKAEWENHWFKFIEGSTCFEQHTAHHQELWTLFAASGLYTHVVTGRCQGWVGKSLI